MNTTTATWPSSKGLVSAPELHPLAHRMRFEVEQTLKSLFADPDLVDNLEEVYLPFANWIARRAKPGKHPFVIGMGGTQGCGKTTLCTVLSRILSKGFDLKTLVISIDDLYKTRSQRSRQAEEVHPLFMTRGVPGTHDLELAQFLFDRLHDLKSGENLRLPSFDKSTDERRDVRLWEEVEGPVDIILFEGWCVGLPPQDMTVHTLAMNDLEREEDAEGKWRAAVNRYLQKEYQPLFERINLMMWMQAPSYDVVYHWRNKQERMLESHLQDIHGEALDKIDLRVMTQKELYRFMQHYERLTRHMLAIMPERSDVILKLDDAQGIQDIQLPVEH